MLTWNTKNSKTSELSIFVTFNTIFIFLSQNMLLEILYKMLRNEDISDLSKDICKRIQLKSRCWEKEILELEQAKSYGRKLGIVDENNPTGF